ncbi:MAG: hypothetical protein EPO32_11135 [Anaerolineae bacterium]|nr:MAG: hypothetical protein EPO32_11135 [Anaerolineae bacterium]
MTSTEQVVLVIVAFVCVFWDALIVYQVLRGETFAFSANKWEAPQKVSRKTHPVAFWLYIGAQFIFPNGALLYLFYFWRSTLAG